jgi:uncharacterized membrane protein YfcA
MIAALVIDYYSMIILLIIFGFGSGVIVGIGSGTSGAFMIPCISVFLGYSIHQAIGTSLIVDCIIGGIAGLIFYKKGKVDLRSGLVLAFTGIIGAFIGSKFTSAAPESELNLFIGIILILLGLNFIINGIRKNVNYIESKFSFKLLKDHKIVSFIALGLIIGLISGFSGIGGGGIVVLVLVFILGYDLHTAIGTSLVMMFFIAGSGALGHAFNNNVIFDVALIAGFAAVVGAVSGSFFANRINEDKLGRLVGVVIVVLGLTILIRMYFLFS